jgi:hypothetical protein
LSVFKSLTIGLSERHAVKKKPHFLEGFKTWWALLCDYRTQITEELKEKLRKIG